MWKSQQLILSRLHLLTLTNNGNRRSALLVF